MGQMTLLWAILAQKDKMLAMVSRYRNAFARRWHLKCTI